MTELSDDPETEKPPVENISVPDRLEIIYFKKRSRKLRIESVVLRKDIIELLRMFTGFGTMPPSFH